jgi:hypothetical protein
MKIKEYIETIFSSVVQGILDTNTKYTNLDWEEFEFDIGSDDGINIDSNSKNRIKFKVKLL